MFDTQPIQRPKRTLTDPVDPPLATALPDDSCFLSLSAMRSVDSGEEVTANLMANFGINAPTLQGYGRVSSSRSWLICKRISISLVWQVISISNRA